MNYSVCYVMFLLSAFVNTHFTMTFLSFLTFHIHLNLFYNRLVLWQVFKVYSESLGQRKGEGRRSVLCNKLALLQNCTIFVVVMMWLMAAKCAIIPYFRVCMLLKYQVILCFHHCLSFLLVVCFNRKLTYM